MQFVVDGAVVRVAARFTSFVGELSSSLGQVAEIGAVIEPPSPQLIKTLSEYGLCTPRDLRRCRPWVRRLARDLPAFDSVWIDGLVHLRKLTHFQARELESGRRNRLSVGPCNLLERLGHSDDAETFLARRRDNGEKCVLKLIDVRIEERLSTLAALKDLAEQFRGSTHRSYVVPHTCLEHDGRLVTISRYASGLHLGELLVRRGRFDADNVMAVARQLVDALTSLEGQGAVHGDISLFNVRLTTDGVVVLLDTGVSATVRPELTIHANRSPERYESVAPELIGTGSLPSSMSDIYSLGCLLWQLLAGRPPFPTGDPLAKLAAHQTKRIRDVRHWAPDTPAPLAEAIAAMTARNPHERPGSFAEIRDRLGTSGRSGRRRLRRFRATFESAVPRSQEFATSGIVRRLPIALLLLVAAGLGAALLDGETRANPGQLPSRIARFVQRQSDRLFGVPQPTETEPKTPIASAEEPAPGYAEIPAADANGLILLDSNRPYSWRRLKSAGTLVIRGKEGKRPTIVVDDTPCQVEARDLILENLHFVRLWSKQTAESVLPALLMVRSQKLTIRGSSLETHRVAADAERSADNVVRPLGVAWKRLGNVAEHVGQIEVSDTLFLGETAGLFLSDAPAELACRNCAKIGGGTMIALSDNVPEKKVLALRLSRLTLRGAESLLRWRASSNEPIRGFVGIQVSDCVIDLAGDRAALVQFLSSKPIDEETTRIAVVGSDSVARPGLEIAARVTAEGQSQGLGGTRVVALEGITTGPFTFAGPLSALPGDASVDSFDMPRRSPHPPGIDASRLRTSPPRIGTRLAN